MRTDGSDRHSDRAALATRLAVASNTLLLGALFYREWARRHASHPQPPLPGNEPTMPPAEVAEDADVESVDLAAMPRALKIIGAVVAPTTLLTGLLFYFGRIYANGSFNYFGVNFTALDLTASDYLIRSADGLIVPLLVAIFLVILALWLHQWLELLPDNSRKVAAWIIAPLAGVVGLVLTALALVDVFGTPLFVTHPEARGILFVLGVVLLAYAIRTTRRLVATRSPQRRTNRPLLIAVGEWGVLFLFVSVGLFWAVGSYASAVGTTRAQQIEASLRTLPAVTIYSEKKLSLKAPGVLETPCSAGSAFQFRYEGLTLILQSGNQYLFLPNGWTHDSGTAFLLPRRDDMRLEFTPGGQPLHAAC